MTILQQERAGNLCSLIQARAYAREMNATLFFSSATHSINVNKIFKFVAAKLFNLPWEAERNLTIGEPIIDFEVLFYWFLAFFSLRVQDCT
ncbi:unnamed protein product [Musa acuminata subsp. malaccensis]|uniref:(wild Malaysian banana) hypothetical protein n=1 Tax=Musa acuminata subsp. malaccensis TaxID=214687 RepID=A0A804KNJ7_MUSAM|nr:unnamed protein product [Musa acuminata subsp. malaccensis]